MALQFDPQKIAQGIQSKAADVAAKATELASDAAAKAADTKRELELQRYCPLFPGQYTDPEFDRPKLIVIRDEDERKGVEVCDGAIGWLNLKNKPEVMNLYENQVAYSGLTFYPRPACDTAYLRDQYDHERYISLESYLSVIRQEQHTELKRVARLLGAKECRLECTESTSVRAKAKAGAHGGIVAPTEAGKLRLTDEANAETGFASEKRNQVLFFERYEGNCSQERPDLKWFRGNTEIENLIDARCSGKDGNRMTEYRMDMSSMTSLAMTGSYAKKIDDSLGKAGLKLAFSLEAEYRSESKKRLLFVVKF